MRPPCKCFAALWTHVDVLNGVLPVQVVLEAFTTHFSELLPMVEGPLADLQASMDPGAFIAQERPFQHFGWL